MNKQRDNIMNIEVDKEFKQNYLVQDNNTAKFMGSGDLEVFATPSLVAFMENAAKEYLNTFLPEELGSEADEQDKKIGDATHTRVIINNEKFLNKLK